MSHPSAHLRRRLAALCPSWDLDGVSGFTYLEGGYSNDNYRFAYDGRRFVLRLCRRASDDPALEQRLYRLDGALGTPPLVAYDLLTSDMVTAWVDGPLLADCDPEPAELVTYLRRLHGALPPVDRLYDPLARARQQLARAQAPDWLRQLAATLRWPPGELRTCHNDLNPWNVICVPGQPWTSLDWEWAGRNDPLFDLVALHQGAGVDAGALEPMAESYLGRPAEPQRLHACLSVYWLRETSWALAELADGHHRPEIAEQRDLGLDKLAALAAD